MDLHRDTLKLVLQFHITSGRKIELSDRWRRLGNWGWDEFGFRESIDAVSRFQLENWKCVRSVSKVWKELADEVYFKGEDWKKCGLLWIHSSIDLKEKEAVSFFLESGVCANTEYEKYTNYIGTPLNQAASTSQTTLVKMMLARPENSPSSSFIYHHPHINKKIIKLYLEHKALDEPTFWGLFESIIRRNRISLVQIAMKSNHFNGEKASSFLEYVISPSMMDVLLSNPQIDPTYDSNVALINILRNGKSNILSRMLQDPRVDLNVCLSVIRRSTFLKPENLPTLEVLLKDPRTILPQDFLSEMAQEDAHSLSLLLSEDNLYQFFNLFASFPHLDYSFNDNIIVRAIAEIGRKRVMELILSNPSVDPSVLDNSCLRIAVEHGNASTVSVLLKSPKVRPSEELMGQLLKQSFNRRYIGTVKALLQDDRTDPNVISVNAVKRTLKNYKELAAAIVEDERVKSTGRMKNLKERRRGSEDAGGPRGRPRGEERGGRGS
eukprot:TRINITY_DN7071_c0_g1_i2.p1 TRINITY_DN7071_c0_g1~~TRINITY_DN7071_c0_g1_i2.p1  ORF type:complete len:494 (+),score=104.02 TRINITY_DN7071_c0_g1_i2:1291-2772(+)